MSRTPAITTLLNGQAMNVLFGSSNMTSSRGSARRRNRAAVAPPNPPPTTTTRGVAWARAMKGAAISAAAPSTARRPGVHAHSPCGRAGGGDRVRARLHSAAPPTTPRSRPSSSWEKPLAMRPITVDGLRPGTERVSAVDGLRRVTPRTDRRHAAMTARAGRRTGRRCRGGQRQSQHRDAASPHAARIV